MFKRKPEERREPPPWAGAMTLEEEMGVVIQKAAPTLEQHMERLAHAQAQFARHYNLACEQAKAYYVEYSLVLNLLSAEKADIERRSEMLDKLKAELPPIGGKDEKVPVEYYSPVDGICSVDGKVEGGSGKELLKPERSPEALPFRPAPLSPRRV